MCVCVRACVHMLDTALGSQTVCSHLLDLGGDLPGQGLHFSVASACPSCPTPNLSSAGFGLGERTLARHCPAWSSLQKNGEQTRCWEELEEPCPWFRSLLLVGEWVGQVCLEAAAGSLQVGDGGWIQAEPRSQRCEGRGCADDCQHPMSTSLPLTAALLQAGRLGSSQAGLSLNGRVVSLQ